MQAIVDLIRDAHPERHHATLPRRCWKLIEELGEVAEAHLNVTSALNGKGKTWDDVREEVVDVLIVALDIALTPIPADIGGPDRVILLGVPLPDITDLTSHEDVGHLLFEIAEAAGHVHQQLGAGNHEDAGEWACSAALSALAFAMMAWPDQPNASRTSVHTAVLQEITRKLAKWNAARAGRSVTETPA